MINSIVLLWKHIISCTTTMFILGLFLIGLGLDVMFATSGFSLIGAGTGFTLSVVVIAANH